jgi:hypothetical protein
MAASNYYLFHGGKEAIGDGTIDLDDATAGVFKSALVLSTWSPSLSADDVWGDISANEHANGSGYTTGGEAVTSVTWTNSAGTMTWDIDDPTWTASGGAITARYHVLYHVASGKLIAYSLLDTTPADVSASDGTAFVVQIHANGVFQLA